MTKGVLWAAIYIIFGIYFINQSFSFLTIPEALSTFDSWFSLIGGILILIGGINHYRASKSSMPSF